MAWIDAHAPPDAIVATTSPHLATCSQAVVPYCHRWRSIRSRHIGCSKPFPCHMSLWTNSSIADMSRRYALPAVESHPAVLAPRA